MMLTIELPWPPKELSPNFKAHWSEKARAIKRYRKLVSEHCLDAKLNIQKRNLIKSGLTLPMKITFCPPDNRKRDKDNMIASFKAGQDGIADILSINDVHFDALYMVVKMPDFAGVIVDFGA